MSKLCSVKLGRKLFEYNPFTVTKHIKMEPESGLTFLKVFQTAITFNLQ